MSWLTIGDWAEKMEERALTQRRERLKIAARHFDVDLLNILGDTELEDQLLERYEAAGLSWPEMDEDEDW